MAEPSLKAVELSLAESGGELTPALEAAQYARFIKPEEPESEAEAQAVGAFIDAFASGTEIWEQGTPSSRTGVLAQLSARIEELERCGLFVHAAAVQLDFALEPGQMLRLPVAIVTITRSNLPRGVVMVPSEIEADAGDGPPRSALDAQRGHVGSPRPSALGDYQSRPPGQS